MFSPPGCQESRLTRTISSEVGPRQSTLEFLHLEPGELRLELDVDDDQPLTLDVLEYRPDAIIVEAFEPLRALRSSTPARIEWAGMGGFLSHARCFVSDAQLIFVNDAPAVRLALRSEAKDTAKLRRLYREGRYPLLPRAQLDPDEVLSLLDASGYLGLRGASFTPTERWLRAHYPPGTSSDLVYCAEDGELLGHVSVTRAYSRSWIGHQLATLRGHAESFACRVALYNHFSAVPALHDGDETHFLYGYYDPSRPWHQLLFEGFVGALDDPSEATCVAFERYEFTSSETPTSAANHHPDLTIAQPRPDELEEVVDFIRPYLPPLARAAFDIDVDTLDRAFLVPAYATSGLRRGRAVFALRLRGRLVGVALCETGSPDLSLFDVFNLAQLYLPIGVSVDLCQVLVDFVRSYYRGLGCSNPLIVTRCATLPSPEALGLEHVETMGCIVWSMTALPRYRRYLDECFVRISPDSLAQPRAHA